MVLRTTGVAVTKADTNSIVDGAVGIYVDEMFVESGRYCYLLLFRIDFSRKA